MAFSGALTLTDLNDFITPAQACIKPVEQSNVKPSLDAGAASTEIRIDSSGSYYEVSPTTTAGTGKKLEQAQISLNDCLACSGCITSAESVLITLQSHTEVLNFLETNSQLSPNDPSTPKKVPVISIAPQTLASLAASISSTSTTPPISPKQALRRVQVFCQAILGFEYVFDTTFARHLALKEHVREFEERTQLDRDTGKGDDRDTSHLPMLASACPGWICYAEKAHSEMLPFIARTKSPQQVMGTLVKNWMGQKWGKQPDEIYHVSVMPCYDKKLEASRSDFYNEAYSTRDVDCVITTGELELMMREKGWDLSAPVPDELDDKSLPPSPTEPKAPHIPELLTHTGSSSGSYLHAILDHVIASTPIPLVLSVKTIRNTDYEEYVLRKAVDAEPLSELTTNGNAVADTRREEGEVVFRGAKCYGFRNLQNVVRKVGKERGIRVGRGAAGRLAGRVGGGARRGRRQVGAGGVWEVKEKEKERGYDYVEVMACPGGCVNGGGQLKPPASAQSENIVKDEEGYPKEYEAGGILNAKWGDREWTKKVEATYWLTSPFSAPPQTDQEMDYADRLARRVLLDLCPPVANHAHPHPHPHAKKSSCTLGTCKSGNCSSQPHTHSDAPTLPGSIDEETRRSLFRTQYRAVESEVIGMAVKW